MQPRARGPTRERRAMGGPMKNIALFRPIIDLEFCEGDLGVAGCNLSRRPPVHAAELI